MNRLLNALVLAATSALFIGNVAVAAPTSNEHSVAVSANSAPSSDTASNNSSPIENDWVFGQPSHSKLTELAQYWFPASYCQTYAGPTCPMVVAVPAGAPCTCYFPDGALRGVAH